MANFQWIGNNAILYKGKICQLKEGDEWAVVNAMKRVDKEEEMERERVKQELKMEIVNEVLAEIWSKEKK